MASGQANSNSDRDRILAATDLVSLVGEQVRLEPKGSEYLGLCPFHDDARPSMYVVPAKGFYHCFACGAHGNAIDFLIGMHGMSFIEALEALASRAGLELTRRGSDPGYADRRRQLMRANHLAAKFFVRTLGEPTGSAALASLEERGIDAEAIKRFGIGAAPDSWDGLVKRIDQVRSSLSESELDQIPSPAMFEAARLISPKRNGGHCDFFRNRIVFPIRDELGRPIAFGARRINPEDEPKYINSPETEVFQKGSTLFGIDLAAKAIGRTGTAIICEGYTDVIALHAAGFENAVATLGTALTREHAHRLGRRCDRVVLLFDGDAAGRRAADRAVEVFFAAPVDVRICSLPEGLDPDELLRRDGGRQEFQAAIDGAEDAFMSMLHGFKRDLEAADGLTARSRVVERTLDRLTSLGVDELSGVRRRFVLRSIADTLGFAPEELERLTGPRRNRTLPTSDSAKSPEVAEPIVRAPRARRLAEEGVLGLLLADPTRCTDEVLGRLPIDRFEDPVCRTIWESLSSDPTALATRSAPDLIGEITNIEAGNLAASLFVEGLRALEHVSLQETPPMESALDALDAAIERSRRSVERRAATERSILNADDAAQALDAIRQAGADPASIPRSPRTRLPRDSHD